MSGAYQIINNIPYQVSGKGSTINLPTGPVETGAAQSKLRASSVFDISLYYQISPELGADIGYNNWAAQLGENGQYRNPFYSPGALFYADVIVFPDQLIKRIITPSKPATQVGQL